MSAAQDERWQRRSYASPNWLVVSLAVLCVGCAKAPLPSRPNVLLMTIDSLRRDHVSAYGYRSPNGQNEATTPHFDRLAEQGVLFLNAQSSSSWTLPAHAALLTGLPDPLHAAVDNDRRIAPEWVTLAELFLAHDYRTAGFFSGPNLHPSFGFDQGFMEYVDCSGLELQPDLFAEAASAAPGSFSALHQASHGAITSPLLFERASAWLKDQEQRPWFCFVHWWDVHYDYQAPSDYVRRFAPQNYLGPARGEHSQEKARAVEPADIAQLRGLYDAEIRHTDDWIGRLLEELPNLNREGAYAVLITSDHGEEFYEHGRWGHQRTLYQEVLDIPMLLYAPGRAPKGLHVEAQVRLQDVYATLAGLCGLAGPDNLESEDLAQVFDDPKSPGFPAYSYLEVPLREVHLSSYKFGPQKASLDHTSGRLWWHDLKRDPSENSPEVVKDLQGPLPSPVQGLLGELERLERVRRGLSFGAHPPPVQLDERTLEALRAAGYLTRE